MTEDSTVFFFLLSWVSALITGLLLALPHLYKCQPQSSLLLWNTLSPKRKEEEKKPKHIVFIVSRAACRPAAPLHFRVLPGFFFFFFFLFQTHHVDCHYSCSLSHFSNSPWHRHFDIQYFNCCQVIHLAVPSKKRNDGETISGRLG